MSSTYRDESRKNWRREGLLQSGDLEVGCLQRIADATELLAKRHADLIGEKERAENSRDYWRMEADRLARSNNALRGQITKLKRKADAA